MRLTFECYSCVFVSSKHKTEDIFLCAQMKTRKGWVGFHVFEKWLPPWSASMESISICAALSLGLPLICIACIALHFSGFVSKTRCTLQWNLPNERRQDSTENKESTQLIRRKIKAGFLKKKTVAQCCSEPLYEITGQSGFKEAKYKEMKADPSVLQCTVHWCSISCRSDIYTHWPSTLTSFWFGFQE